MAKLSKASKEGLKGLTVSSVTDTEIELSDGLLVELPDELIEETNEDYGEDEEDNED